MHSLLTEQSEYMFKIAYAQILLWMWQLLKCHGGPIHSGSAAFEQMTHRVAQSRHSSFYPDNANRLNGEGFVSASPEPLRTLSREREIALPFQGQADSAPDLSFPFP